MAWVVTWSWWSYDRGRPAPAHPLGTPLPDQAIAPLPPEVRRSLLNRALAQADRAAPRLLDIKV